MGASVGWLDGVMDGQTYHSEPAWGGCVLCWLLDAAAEAKVDGGAIVRGWKSDDRLGVS